MSTYRPEHQPWHDDLPEPCTCDKAWSGRDLVDSRCWHHQAIDVLDTLGLGGGELYRWDGEWEENQLTSGRFNQRKLVKVWPPERNSK